MIVGIWLLYYCYFFGGKLSKYAKIASLFIFTVLTLFFVVGHKPAAAKAAGFDLVQTPGDGRVFLKENGCKRHIKDYNTFLSFGFNAGMIRQVGRAEFDSYPTAPELTTVMNYNGRVYAIISGMKAYVTTGDALTLNGFSWADLQPFADPTFGMLPDAPPLYAPVYRAIHIPSLGRVYLIENGYRRWIKDWNTWMAWKPFTGDFVNLESARSMVEAPPLSQVLNYNGSVYAIIGGQKAYVTTGAALTLNGFSWADLQPFADPTFGQIPTAPPLYAPRIIGCSDGLYFLTPTSRHHIEDWATYLALGGSYTPTDACSTIAVGPSLTRLIQGPDGRVMYIDSNIRRYVPDPGTFAGYGFSWASVRGIGQDVIDMIPEGAVMARWVSNLNGVDIPATSGRTGLEQHLWTNRGETNDAGHYAITNVPLNGPYSGINIQNGVAGQGAFGKLDPTVEQWYITMRWTYCTGWDDTAGCTGGVNASVKNWTLGKKVIVSNSTNGRKIVVAVGDFGPANWVTAQQGVVSGLSPEATDYMVGSRHNTGGDVLDYGWAVDQTLPLGPLTW